MSGHTDTDTKNNIGTNYESTDSENYKYHPNTLVLSLSLSLLKTSTVDDKNIENILNYYKNNMARHDYYQKVAKASDIEREIDSLRKQLDVLQKNIQKMVIIKNDSQQTDIIKIKKDSQDSKYQTSIYFFHDGLWRDFYIDVRDITVISVSLYRSDLNITIEERSGQVIKSSIPIPKSIVSLGKDNNYKIIMNWIKRERYLDFFNQLTEYKGCISAYNIKIFDYIGRCKKIRELKIRCYDYDMNMKNFLDFSEIKKITLLKSKKIHNIYILKHHKSLENLVIDSTTEQLSHLKSDDINFKITRA